VSRPPVIQNVEAIAGFAYGVIGADLHVLGDGTPVYVLENHRGPSAANGKWLRELPSRMLNARYEVVEFTGRGPELAALDGWRRTGPRLAVRWLHAPGGQGKTRLASRFARMSITDGWKVVIASPGRGAVLRQPGSQDLRLNGASGLLMIIDYADRWPQSHLTWLLSNSLLHQTGVPTRVLMIARTTNSWPGIRSTLANHQADTSAQRLANLPDDREHRGRMFTAARDGFAAIYGILDPASIGEPRLLRTDDFGLTLALHMAALVAVDAHANGLKQPDAMADLTIYLVDRESAHWTAMYENRTVGLDYRTPPSVMTKAVFAAALTGAVSHVQGMEVLGALGRGLPADRVLEDHSKCYPPTLHIDSSDPEPAPSRVLEPLYPDRLAEDFIATTLLGLTDHLAQAWAPTALSALTARTAGGAAVPWVARAMTFLTSATKRWPQVGKMYLYPLLKADPKLAVEAGSAVLVALADIDDEDLPVLKAIEGHLPSGRQVDLDPGIAAISRRLTHDRLKNTRESAEQAKLLSKLALRLAHAGLRDEALQVSQQAVEICRQFLPGYQRGLALALNNLGNRLAEMGRWEESLRATEEALAVSRTLANSTDDAEVLAELAGSLNNLGNSLAITGRVGDALKASQDAVGIYRTLPQEHEPQLALALNNLGSRLATIGQRVEALATAEQSIEVYRRLGQTRDASTFEPEFALALINLGERLSQMGRLADAVRMKAESVEICKRLARANSVAYEPRLADALSNLSWSLTSLGKRDEAVLVASEAVDIWRRLAPSNPAAFESNLASSLQNLGVSLSQSGRLTEALSVTEETVTLYRRLAGTLPAYVPELASALSNFGGALHAQSRWEEAERAISEAVELYRGLVEVNPAAYLPSLALSLNNLAPALSQEGRPNEALQAAREAVEIRRALADDNPAAFEADLALSLMNVAAEFGDQGFPANALTPNRDAIAVYRRLSSANPEAFEPWLAMSLSNLSRHLFDLGSVNEAIDAAEESLSIRTKLASRNPAAFEPDLANSMTRLGPMLSKVGRSQEALTVTREAVDIYRRLAQTNAAAFNPELARALLIFGMTRSTIGIELEAARSAITESIDMFTALAQESPALYAIELKRAHETLMKLLGVRLRFMKPPPSS
jgi:tetratricopeptide (TPR) repeat protein